jgi:hypothetical protein
VANHITVHRAIPSGAALDLSVRATRLRDHPRGRQFDVQATASLDGAEVWRGLSTYLRLGPRPPVTDDQLTGAGLTGAGLTGRLATDGSGVRSTTGDDSGNGARPAGSGAGDAWPVSARVAGGVWRVPARVGADYAAVSGDRNPIHTSRLGARLFGFPRPIAHGMWTKARALAALEGRLPDAYAVDVTFKKALLLPARATFVTAPEADGWTFELASSHPHLTGMITRLTPEA